MLFSKYKDILNEKLSKHTDSELHHLESKFRDGFETDAADACSAILLARRNRPILAKDEYGPRGLTDQDFTREDWG